MKQPLYVVVGCAPQSIGWHVVRQLAGTGVAVLAADLHGESSVPPRGNIWPFQVDVTDPLSVLRLGIQVDRMTQEGYEFKGLVYAAGINRISSIHDAHHQDFLDTMAINLTGAWLTVKAIVTNVPTLYNRVNMVFLGSNTAFVPRTNSAAYAASKAGLVQMVRCLHRELAEDGYRLMTVDPGPVANTNMDQATAEALEEQRGWDYEEYERQISRSVPIGRMAQPQEIAAWIRFLLDNGELAGGTSIRLDGGQVSGRG